jgi:H/ACA ribonucleoprotein complex subunit 3
MVHILKCETCGSYGLDEKCSCGSTRKNVSPAKYSPEDKYAEYRRTAKKQQEEQHEQ